MTRELLLGLDVGTTVLKAAVFDGSGRVLARASRALNTRVGAGGAREQDAAESVAALADAVRGLRGKLGRRFGHIRGVGLAAQAGSTLIADRRAGTPHTPLLLWNDSRAASYHARVRKAKPAAYWRRLTWRDPPGWGLARLLWLREKRPGLLSSRNIYAGAGEFLFFQLTGAWRQDAGNALQIGCYDAPRMRLTAAPLKLVDVPLSFFAPLREGHSTQPLSAGGARLLRLTQGLPVAGPYFDHEAGYLAAARCSLRPLLCSLGTAWVGSFVLPAGSAWTSPFQFVLPNVLGAGWLVVQPLLTGNVTWDWALETFAHAKLGIALGKAADIFRARLLPPPGLTALPWLNRPNPLRPELLGGGVFCGLGPRTTREDMLRAVAAGMTYEMARVFAEVKARRCVDKVVLSGGASRGVYFQQLLAALFHPLPIEVLGEEADAGARGAVWALNGNAARASARPVRPPPAPLRRRIAEDYRRYLRLFERLYADVPEGGAIRFPAGRSAKK